MPAPMRSIGRAGTRLALLRIGTGGRVASHLGTRVDLRPSVVKPFGGEA